MPLFTLKFDSCENEQRTFVSKSMDEWKYKRTHNRSFFGEKTYIHIIQLIRRNDGLNLPIQALVHRETSSHPVVYEFRLGRSRHIALKEGDVTITYFIPRQRAGDVNSDLLEYVHTHEDIELEADRKKILVNKVLLEARSNVFQAMFAHETQEAHTNRVEFTDMSSSALEDFVHFLKTDRVPNIHINAVELGFIAEKFELPLLFEIVVNYLEKNINESNYSMVSLLACTSNSQRLHTALGQFKPNKNGYVNKHSFSFI